MSFGMKAIVPKGALQIDVFRREIDRTLTTEGNQDRRAAARLTSTWSRKNKPRWETVIFTRRGDRVAFTSPQPGSAADNFWRVERGTPPHIIRAKSARALRFHRASSPKSVPGIAKSYPRRNFGAPIYRKWVRHPGTKPRRRLPVVERERLPYFQRLMAIAIRKAAKAAWG